MTYKYNILKVVCMSLLLLTSCHDVLDEPAENRTFLGGTDYTDESNMILPLLGAYAEFYSRGWEDYPIISVRGDDVNAGGLGDQQPFSDTDRYVYAVDYWMYNSVWQNLYNDILHMHSTMEQVERYKEFATNPSTADQYIAEAMTLRAFLLFNVSRVWGDVFIPSSSDPLELLQTTPATKDEVMQHISDQMDVAIPLLPSVHPNERTDIPGGVTKFTALAIKALANLELKNYSAVAEATSQIIASGEFSLEDDYYNLFKKPGKLNDENILELQYSDFGTPSGQNISYLFAFFGPESWTPVVANAAGGWGFFEPSLDYIKFMIDRDEEVRLPTTVIFTPRGIEELQSDPNYATLPPWISNVTASGDVFNNYNRAMFVSGKHYLPSNQLTPGRTDYGTSKNFTAIRYAEILLMHAEARVQGGTAGISADEAVNQVRDRAGLAPLSGVTLQDVLDEKLAELAMEWGIRYYDLIRYQEYDELSYGGRNFTPEKTFLPYPQFQVDQLPVLENN